MCYQLRILTLISSRLAPEIRWKGMWCHLFGLSCALWIVAWIVAVYTVRLCMFSHILPMIRQPQKDLQTWLHPCVLIIPLLMLLLGPLITLVNWLHKHNFHPFVDTQGKESFNFQLSVSIYVLLAQFFFELCLFRIEHPPNGAFGMPPTVLFWTGLLIAFFFFPLLTAFQAILVIFAAYKAAKGQNYRYPFTMRFLK